MSKLSWEGFPIGAAPTRELLQYIPQLSLAERDRRWSEVRTRMASKGIDALLLVGNDSFFGMGTVNLRYLTQVGSVFGGYALFQADDDPVVWNSNQPQMQRPTNPYLGTQEWVSDIRINHGVEAVAGELRDRGLEKATIGLAPFSSTLVTIPLIFQAEMESLRRELPSARVLDAASILQELRQIKSPEEISLLTSAAQIARKAVDAMITTAKPGMTEAQVYAEMVKAQIVNGAEPSVFNLLSSGPVDHSESEIWHLLHGAEQPAAPSMRPLSKGDVVISEFHTQYGGYLAATEFSVYVGQNAPEKLKDVWKVCVECFDATLEVMKPGKTLEEVWKAVRRPAEVAGMDFVELGFHGHGMASPEFPTVVHRPEMGGPKSMCGEGIEEVEIQEGMVFGNNIDVYNPKWKMDVGCMYGDLVVVGPSGAEPLVHVPRELPESV
ncbi:MAG: aminopeptidase P family protein [Actinomycetota bacterium]|nr:MAG: aminopeptidase P family protein [Actinomycetota bacterium]